MPNDLQIHGFRTVPDSGCRPVLSGNKVTAVEGIEQSGDSACWSLKSTTPPLWMRTRI